MRASTEHEAHRQDADGDVGDDELAWAAIREGAERRARAEQGVFGQPLLAYDPSSFDAPQQQDDAHWEHAEWQHAEAEAEQPTQGEAMPPPLPRHQAPLLLSATQPAAVAHDSFEDDTPWKPQPRPAWHVLAPALACALAAGAGVVYHLAANAEQQARVERTLKEIQVHSATTADEPPKAVTQPTAEVQSSETLAAFMRLNSAPELTGPAPARAPRSAPARPALSGTQTLPWVRTKYEVRNESGYASRPTTDATDAPQPTFNAAPSSRPVMERVSTAKPTPRHEDAANPSNDPLFGL